MTVRKQPSWGRIQSIQHSWMKQPRADAWKKFKEGKHIQKQPATTCISGTTRIGSCAFGNSLKLGKFRSELMPNSTCLESCDKKFHSIQHSLSALSLNRQEEHKGQNATTGAIKDSKEFIYCCTFKCLQLEKTEAIQIRLRYLTGTQETCVEFRLV